MTDIAAFVTVRAFTSVSDAQLACTVLQAAGLDARLGDEHLVSMQWLYSNAVGGVKLQVPLTRSTKHVRYSTRRLWLTSRWYLRAWSMSLPVRHYADDVEFRSPLAARLLDDKSGMIRGKQNLREYLVKALAAFPGDLGIEFLGVYQGVRKRHRAFPGSGKARGGTHGNAP